MKEKQIDNKKSKGKRSHKQVVKNFLRLRSVIIVSACVALIILLLCVFIYSQSFSVVAKINGESISRTEFVSELENRFGTSALDALISDILINQAAKEVGITITDSEIDDEIALVEAQVIAQGGTLEDLLQQQGLNRESLRKQVKNQKILEIVLAENVAVTEADIDAFIEANGPLPEGQDKVLRPQIVDQLRSQKFTTAVQSYLVGLRTRADIRYYVDYE